MTSLASALCINFDGKKSIKQSVLLWFRIDCNHSSLIHWPNIPLTKCENENGMLFGKKWNGLRSPCVVGGYMRCICDVLGEKKNITVLNGPFRICSSRDVHFFSQMSPKCIISHRILSRVGYFCHLHCCFVVVVAVIFFCFFSSPFYIAQVILLQPHTFFWPYTWSFDE